MKCFRLGTPALEDNQQNKRVKVMSMHGERKVYEHPGIDSLSRLFKMDGL